LEKCFDQCGCSQKPLWAQYHLGTFKEVSAVQEVTALSWSETTVQGQRKAHFPPNENYNSSEPLLTIQPFLFRET
jgi:hypothetical protein